MLMLLMMLLGLILIPGSLAPIGGNAVVVGLDNGSISLYASKDAVSGWTELKAFGPG